MANIDQDRNRISAVVLFYGPPGSGKTTSLYALSRILPPGTHGKVAPLVQGDSRLLRLDYRPHDQELVFGYQVNFRLVTCTGQIDVDLLRPIIGAVDAILYVADSAPDALTANVKSFELLDRMLRSGGRRLSDLPIVFMYNKRDLRDAVDIRTLQDRLNRQGGSYVASSAVRGQGVLEAVQGLTASLAMTLREDLQEQDQSVVTGSNIKTVAHGPSFAAAQAMLDPDDATAVNTGRATVGWDVTGDDDRTEVNAAVEDGWSAPRAGTGPARLGRPAEPAGRRTARASQTGSVEPVIASGSWRTPESLADGVDSDDRTLPGQAVAELVAESRLQASGGIPEVADVASARARARAQAQSSRGVPSARAAGATDVAPRARRMDGTERSVAPPGYEPAPRPERQRPERAEPAPQRERVEAAAETRAPEAWESEVMRTGHTLRVPVDDLSGYVVSRIGTPVANSRRNIRFPVRATHMDTLVPQDFVIELDLRGAISPSTGAQAMSARRDDTQVAGDARWPSWVPVAVGILVVILVAALVVMWIVNG